MSIKSLQARRTIHATRIKLIVCMDRKKSQCGYISPISSEASIEAICIKNCLVGDVLANVKFQNEIFRGYDFTGVEFSISY